MKSAIVFLSAFIIVLAAAAGNIASAKDSAAVFPKLHKELKMPSKATSCKDLNKFVTQCFTLYNTTNIVRAQLQTTFENTTTVQPSQVEELLTQTKSGYANLTAVLPQVENLIATAPDLFSSVKNGLPMLEYPRAILNFKAACQALKYSAEDVKYMATTTVPSIKAILGGKNKTAGTDSTLAVAEIIASRQ